MTRNRSGFHNRRMVRNNRTRLYPRRNHPTVRVLIKVSAVLCVALVLAFVTSDTSFSGQNRVLRKPPLEMGAATHETWADSQTALLNVRETPAEIEPVSTAPSTRSSFTATWNNVAGATGYLLDVSTSESFTNYVDGYHDLEVGNVTGCVVTRLNPGTTYYYRVRSHTTNGMSNYSEAMTAATVPTTGLIIRATFDSSITGNPNAAAIEAMINRAISIYESLFSDPITIQIRFRYATTAPDGSPLPANLIARSNFVYYVSPWNAAVDALRADATSSNDDLAIASLPGSALSANIKPSSANGRAAGRDTPPAMFADGTVGPGGPYDGIVTLNSSASYQFTRPPNANNYDAQRATEHEIDEVMGLGSRLNLNPPGTDLRPQDVFSWSSAGHRNINSSGTRYFSINGGATNIANFNQNPSGDFGDWLSTACPQVHPYVQNAFSCRGQYSDVTATSPEGINLDVIGYNLAQTSAGSGLGNISTRSFVQIGQNVMIGGFIVQGTGPKRVIIRAIGPELTQYGITNALANPRLELHNHTGALIASNDNWQTTILGGVITGDQVSQIQNSGHAPTATSESAIIASLQPGNYTAVVRGVNNTTGVALVEVYDLNPAASSSLGNISTRSLVQTGQNVMIGGFIVHGTGAKRVIIRAIGPELTQYGITNVLANPTLELHNATGALIASNNDWHTTIIGGIIGASQVTAIQNSGHGPTQPSESAIIASLQPGNYTAIVRGRNNTMGVALVEVYDLQ
jgi:hypothetical protein